MGDRAEPAAPLSALIDRRTGDGFPVPETRVVPEPCAATVRAPLRARGLAALRLVVAGLITEACGELTA